MKTETGVMVMKNGKAWGCVYKDGHTKRYGWIDVENALIHDPRYVKKPTSVTYDGSRYVAELTTAKVVPVKRTTIVEILESENDD